MRSLLPSPMFIGRAERAWEEGVDRAVWQTSRPDQSRGRGRWKPLNLSLCWVERRANHPSITLLISRGNHEKSFCPHELWYPPGANIGNTHLLVKNITSSKQGQLLQVYDQASMVQQTVRDSGCVSRSVKATILDNRANQQWHWYPFWWHGNQVQDQES